MNLFLVLLIPTKGSWIMMLSHDFVAENVFFKVSEFYFRLTKLINLMKNMKSALNFFFSSHFLKDIGLTHLWRHILRVWGWS